MTTELPVRPVVDVDDPGTWPAQLAALAENLAALAPADDPDYAYEDLPIDKYEGQARRLLTGYLARARHCTRLLDYEADTIRAEGLRLLTSELIIDRLNHAHQRGYLTAAEHRTLSSGNRLVGGRSWARPDGRIFFFLSTFVLRNRVYQVQPLLSTWGGEAIYGNFNENPAEQLLTATLHRLGRPAIVTALLDLSNPQQHTISKSLVHAIVGRQLGAGDADAVVNHVTAVPPEQIESVAFPGEEAYDRFPRLPRS